MQSKITITVLALMFLLVTAGLAAAKSFDDVPTTHWAYDAVEYLASKGLVEGYPDGTFQGNKNMTRYELAMIVARTYAKMEQTKGEGVSIDVQSIMRDLMDEFGPELDEIRDMVKSNKAKIDDLERQLKENSERDAQLADKFDKLATKIKFNGIMKLRADGMYWSPGDAERHRPRISFRFDMKAPVNDEITFGARLGTGGVGANVASETTLSDNFGIKAFDLERAYLMWEPAAWPNWTVYCGKYAPVWATPSNFIDSDVNIEGVSAIYRAHDWMFNISAMTPAEKGGYIVAQLGTEDLFVQNLDLYLAYHYASSGAFETLWTEYPYWYRLDADNYSAVEIYGKYMYEWSKDWPVFFEAAYRMNLASKINGLPINEDSGLHQAAMAQVTFGKIKEVNDMNFHINYGRVLPNAIIPQFADSTLGVDKQTWRVGMDYKLMEHTLFKFAYVNASNLLTNPDGGFDYWCADLIFDF